MTTLLTTSQVEEFAEQGYLVIKGFYECDGEIEPIQYGIWKILGILLNKYNIGIKQEPFSPQNFDYGYQPGQPHKK